MGDPIHAWRACYRFRREQKSSNLRKRKTRLSGFTAIGDLIGTYAKRKTVIHPLVSPRESKHDMKLWKARGDVSEGTDVRCSRRHASFLPAQDKREEHAKFKLLKNTRKVQMQY